MKKLFLQLWQYRSDRIGERQAFLFNGMHYVWDEAQPVWMELKHGCWDNIPDADEIYVTANGYMTAVKMWEWAKRSPHQKFILGGPLVQMVTLCPIEKLPDNLILNSQMAETLFDKTPDPMNFKIVVPPEANAQLFYLFPYKTNCEWGKCKFCIEPKGEERKWSLKPLSDAPKGFVCISGPNMTVQDILDFRDVNTDGKVIRIALRAEERNLKALEELAKVQNPDHFTLAIGVEFPSDRMLTLMRKGVTLDQYIKFLNGVNDLGFRFGMSFIQDWGCLVPSDLEDAKRFFEGIKNVWSTKHTNLVVHTPMIAYTGNLNNYDKEQLDLNPVLMGPFLVGYYMKQDKEQERLNSEWIKIVTEHGFTRTLGKWNR